jgi:hypothetical protein
VSANPHWEVTLARSSNLQQIDLLPYAFSFTPVFNRPGSLSMTLPLNDDVAYKVAKHSTCVVCERNDAVKWSGSIVSVSSDPAAMTMTISALGWLDELNHRFVRADEESVLSFVEVSGDLIASQLISTVNAQEDTSGTARPTHLHYVFYADTFPRSRSYKRGQNYGQAIQELSDVENGFDVVVDPVTRAVTFYPPTSFVDRQDVLFGYDVEPFNLSNATQSDDGSSTANRITAVGSNGVAVPADDVTAIAAEDCMREDWLSLSDVADATIVGAYANAELVYRRWGQVTYDLKPLPYGDVPRLYDDFELGDKVYLSVDAGALKVDRQALRVFSVTLDVDAQGNEALTQVGTAPQT